MSKIDLIIENIEYSKLVTVQAHIDELLEEALAAARSLRKLKPVAWETYGLTFADGKVLYHTHPKQLPLDRRCRPLYALDEHSNFVSSGTAYPIIDAVTK